MDDPNNFQKNEWPHHDFDMIYITNDEIHEKAHEKEETLGAEGQKFFKKAILRDDSSSLRYSSSKNYW